MWKDMKWKRKTVRNRNDNIDLNYRQLTRLTIVFRLIGWLLFRIFTPTRDLQFIRPICSTTWAGQTAKRKLCHHLQLSLLSQFHRSYWLPSETPRRLLSFARVLILGAVNVELGSYYQLRCHDIRCSVPTTSTNYHDVRDTVICVNRRQPQYAPTTKRFWEEVFRAVSLHTTQPESKGKRAELHPSPSLSPPLVIRDCGSRQAPFLCSSLWSKRLKLQKSGLVLGPVDCVEEFKTADCRLLFWGIRINTGARTGNSTSISIYSTR